MISNFEQLLVRIQFQIVILLHHKIGSVVRRPQLNQQPEEVSLEARLLRAAVVVCSAVLRRVNLQLVVDFLAELLLRLLVAVYLEVEVVLRRILLLVVAASLEELHRRQVAVVSSVAAVVDCLASKDVKLHHSLFVPHHSYNFLPYSN